MLKVISSTPETLKNGVKASMYTINVTGNADTSASLIFDQSSFKNHHSLHEVHSAYNYTKVNHSMQGHLKKVYKKIPPISRSEG